MSEGPLAAYRRLRRAGKLKPDPAQELAAEKLEALHHQLQHYDPRRQAGWRAFFSSARRQETPPQGLYLFGEVGRGKSMLMDLFFATAPVPKKRRVHFHAFMQEVHGEIHKWRQADAKVRNGDDPIPPLAQKIAERAWLLCFDEFQVTNVADAMILGRLFETLFRLGVVVVATSNRGPDELYRGGINRELFLPFIALFKSRLDLLELEEGIDYRMARFAGLPLYHTPLGPEADARLDAAFAQLIEGAAAKPETLAIQGRAVTIGAQAKGVARASFAELCEQPLGPADYLAIAARYHSLVLSGIPKIEPAARDLARRFITLVDALYEAKTKLFCSAAVPPAELYPSGDGSLDFPRTVSRLMEMQSREYLALPHQPGD